MSVSASPVRASTTSVLGRRGEGDVALDAVEHEAVAVGDGPHLHALGSEAVLGLEPRRGEDGLALGDAGQDRLALLVGAEAQHDAGAEHGGHEVRRGRQAPAQLLVDDGALDHRHARPAVLLGQREPDEVELGQLRPQRGRVPDRVVLQLAHDGERRHVVAPGCAPGCAACPALR